MRDLTKYDINDLRNLVTRQEAQIAAYKIQIQELEEKIQEKENENYCPQCGREFSKEFRYLENCVYCGQRLDWRKI